MQNLLDYNLKLKVSKNSALFLVILFLLLGSAGLVQAETAYEYTVLAPLPGTTNDTCDTSDPNNPGCKTVLEKYLPGLFNLAIGISAAFAVLMIVIGGFQYMSTDALQKKQDGRERIKNAILGLFLVIGAWIILYTINPNLLNLNLSIEPVSIAPTATSPETLSAPPPPDGKVDVGSVVVATKATCPNCIFSAPTSAYTNTKNPLRPEDFAKFSCQSCLPLVGVPNNGNTNTNVDPSIRDNIMAMNEDLKSQNIDWRLNEAFPPTVHHKADCSYNGTCIDAGLKNNSTENIKRFIETANNNGLRVQYEVKTPEEANKIRNELKAAGVTGDLTKIVIPVSYINNPHFSVYKKP